jgi:hypothetical protein
MTLQPETAVTVDALARMLSAADVEINHGDYPTWDTLAESGQKQYRQAARYLLKRLHITAPAAVSAAVAPPTNRAALRDRIAEALRPWVFDSGHGAEEGAAADAVLAVLPTTDRTAVLREANWIVEHCPDHGCVEPSTEVCHCEIADRLRRMADETATETPAAEPTAEDIARAHVTSLHLIGEQLATIESWFWEHLADVRDAGARQDQTATETPHTCKPGASTYYCPTSGQTESDCHGGFTTCCDRPDLHQPAAGARQDGAES